MRSSVLKQSAQLAADGRSGLVACRIRGQGRRAAGLSPTRDVDITYDVTRPQKPKIRERVRW
jgi:hypothetical protein